MVCQRHTQRFKKADFERLFQSVQHPDKQNIIVDSACWRAHQSSAKTRKMNCAQTIGITRGASNTKIHASCNVLRNPLCFVLIAGQRHDFKPVPELLGGLQAKAFLADKT